MPWTDAVIAVIAEDRAAWTVAFGIQAKAMKTRSLQVYLCLSMPVTKTTVSHLTVTPTKNVKNAYPIRDPSNLAT